MGKFRASRQACSGLRVFGRSRNAVEPNGEAGILRIFSLSAVASFYGREGGVAGERGEYVLLLSSTEGPTRAFGVGGEREGENGGIWS